MSRHAWIVLATYPSSSSSSIHEVRRGGDGCLYCSCLGWRNSKATPKDCTHLRKFIAANPGTSRGPGYAPEYPQSRNVIEPDKRPLVERSAPVVKPTSPAGADWRALLLAEREGAVKRGVKQEPAAMAAYALDLDLD